MGALLIFQNEYHRTYSLHTLNSKAVHLIIGCGLVRDQSETLVISGLFKYFQYNTISCQF